MSESSKATGRNAETEQEVKVIPSGTKFVFVLNKIFKEANKIEFDDVVVKAGALYPNGTAMFFKFTSNGELRAKFYAPLIPDINLKA